MMEQADFYEEVKITVSDFKSFLASPGSIASAKAALRQTDMAPVLDLVPLILDLVPLLLRGSGWSGGGGVVKKSRGW